MLGAPELNVLMLSNVFNIVWYHLQPPYVVLLFRVRRARAEGKNPKSCDETFERLITEGVDPDDLYHEVTHQVIPQSTAPVHAGLCQHKSICAHVCRPSDTPMAHQQSANC